MGTLVQDFRVEGFAVKHLDVEKVEGLLCRV